jgi:hypothetical protein
MSLSVIEPRLDRQWMSGSVTYGHVVNLLARAATATALGPVQRFVDASGQRYVLRDGSCEPFGGEDDQVPLSSMVRYTGGRQWVREAARPPSSKD